MFWEARSIKKQETLAMKTPLHWYFSNASINFAKSRQGKSNHCNYSRQYCKTTSLLVWNSGNLILAWLNFTNMIKTLSRKMGKLPFFLIYENNHYKLCIFEVDYIVILCLSQNLIFWKIRKKIGYFFRSFQKSLVDFWKKSGNTG